MRPGLSTLRKEILNQVKRTKLPLNAKNIHARNKDTDLSTVYRALDYLESHGALESITVSCSCGINRYYHVTRPHVHYLHCESCHDFFMVSQCGIGKIEEEMKSRLGFSISRHVLYFMGTCKKCSCGKYSAKGNKN
jgi:Fur family transcriptional regulator, ferric uptake regulator